MIKTVWYWHEERHIGQWNKVQESKISHIYGHSYVFDKDSKPTHKEIISFCNN